jgi:hypothetical protein
MGHGPWVYKDQGTPNEKQIPAPNTVKFIKDTLGNPKTLCPTSRYGIYSCWPDAFNKEIAAENRAAASLEGVDYKQITDIMAQFVEKKDALMKQIDGLLADAQCSNGVTVNLYLADGGKLNPGQSQTEDAFTKLLNSGGR